MYTMIALLVMLCCTIFCLAEASTTFEDLSLGGCQCKSCNCGSVHVVQKCPTDSNMAIKHESKQNPIVYRCTRGNFTSIPGEVTSFSDLQLSECSCEACTCDKVLDIEDCSEGEGTGMYQYKFCGIHQLHSYIYLQITQKKQNHCTKTAKNYLTMDTMSLEYTQSILMVKIHLKSIVIWRLMGEGGLCFRGE